jgi:hypothetical protein
VSAGSAMSVTILPKLFDFGSTSMIAMPSRRACGATGLLSALSESADLVS